MPICLDRFQQRNQSIEIFLYMEAQTLPDVIGYNLVAEIKGSTLPDETVLVSGHLDSWDVGQGKIDHFVSSSHAYNFHDFL